MRVAMVISNGYEPDVRVQKEAHTLALAGYDVTVIAWDRVCQFAPHELEPIPEGLASALAEWPGRVVHTPGAVPIIRIQTSAGYRTGRRLLLKMPIFGWRLLGELRRLRPDVVHAHDLDTLPVAYLYHKLARVPVVFDAREFYPGMVRANVGGALSLMLDRLDHWLAPRVDAILTVGERLAARYRDMGGRVWVVHNSQPLPDRVALDRVGTALRRSWGVPDDALLVIYVGMLTPDRLLTPILEAVPKLDHVWLAVGGYGPQLPAVQEVAKACKRILVLGRVPLAEVSSVVAAGDVIYYGLEAHDLNSFYFMPNLAFFALAVGRPLLTTPVGEIADVVQREGCGVVMADTAETALQQLSDPAFRATLADRARYLGQDEYTWMRAATQLGDVYHTLFLR